MASLVGRIKHATPEKVTHSASSYSDTTICSVLYCFSHVRLLCDPMDCSSPGSFCLCDFPGKNTGVGCHFLFHQYSIAAAAAAAKSLQSCPTLCDPIDGSPPGSTVLGILQARTLEWVAISFSNAWKWKGKVKLLSCVQLLATPWTAAHQAPPSTGFSRRECWSGGHCLLRHMLWQCHITDYFVLFVYVMAFNKF